MKKCGNDKAGQYSSLNIYNLDKIIIGFII